MLTTLHRQNAAHEASGKEGRLTIPQHLEAGAIPFDGRQNVIRHKVIWFTEGIGAADVVKPVQPALTRS